MTGPASGWTSLPAPVPVGNAESWRNATSLFEVLPVWKLPSLHSQTILRYVIQIRIHQFPIKQIHQTNPSNLSIKLIHQTNPSKTTRTPSSSIIKHEGLFTRHSPGLQRWCCHPSAGAFSKHPGPDATAVEQPQSDTISVLFQV